MARIQVTAKSDSTSVEFVDADGTTVREVEPMEIFSVGNSIGGYIAAPMDLHGSRWGLWRLGGADKALLNELRKDGSEEEFYSFATPFTREKPEKVTVNGREYLLATTSGSARRGIIHAYRRPEAERDPINRVLRELGLGLSILERVNDDPIQVNGRWYDQGPIPHGSVTRHWVTDGSETEVSRQRVEGMRHYGGGGRVEIAIEGGTYVVQQDCRRAMGGGSTVTISRVVVRTGCDPDRLREALAKR